MVKEAGIQTQVRNDQDIRSVSMSDKHQNSYDDYIVVGGKRRWFGTPMSTKDSPTKPDAYSEQSSSAKKRTVA
ncbi:hypothetical protein [Synechococcus sp. BIOS-E4-1]|uniref:hypothetical protein n=1 Tax=Synechococcus sp. BIOS-E4-1 TaxID=1400864 RepID=UPI00164889D9|nr:hypothetical protein [Synechococcus sp. BIOS-E4-1]